MNDRSHTSADTFDCASAIERCARGEEAALRQIFEAEGPRLLGVALRILRRRDLAEEAVQETLVNVWRRAKTFDRSKGSGRAWLYTILRNRTLTILRAESRDPGEELLGADPQHDRIETDAAWDRLADTNALRACLERLDAPRREAVVMSYVLGYTHAEIAGRLNAPLGTTKSWLKRSLAFLRECLS